MVGKACSQEYVTTQRASGLDVAALLLRRTVLLLDAGARADNTAVSIGRRLAPEYVCGPAINAL